MPRRFSLPLRFDLLLAYALAAAILIYLSYALPRLLPGDFLTSLYSGSPATLTPEQEKAIRDFYTLDEGFGRYLTRLVSLDWGYSYVYLTPISSLILEALPWTLLLMGSAHFLSMVLGFLVGVEMAWRRGGGLEKGLVGGMTVLEGLPEISTGVLLLVIFAFYLQWLPAAGAETAYAQLSGWAWLLDVARHLALPLATLVLAYFPGNFLLTRGSMLLVLNEPFVAVARAKGLPAWRVRYAHAARNALLPVVTRFGLRLAFMVTGALVVETIYSYPGLGTLLFRAIGSRDLPLIQNIVLLSSLSVLAVNLGLEITYCWLDPRVRHAC